MIENGEFIRFEFNSTTENFQNFINELTNIPERIDLQFHNYDEGGNGRYSTTYTYYGDYNINFAYINITSILIDSSGINYYHDGTYYNLNGLIDIQFFTSIPDTIPPILISVQVNEYQSDGNITLQWILEDHNPHMYSLLYDSNLVVENASWAREIFYTMSNQLDAYLNFTLLAFDLNNGSIVVTTIVQNGNILPNGIPSSPSTSISDPTTTSLASRTKESNNTNISSNGTTTPSLPVPIPNMIYIISLIVFAVQIKRRIRSVD